MESLSMSWSVSSWACASPPQISTGHYNSNSKSKPGTVSEPGENWVFGPKKVCRSALINGIDGLVLHVLHLSGQ